MEDLESIQNHPNFAPCIALTFLERCIGLGRSILIKGFSVEPLYS